VCFHEKISPTGSPYFDCLDSRVAKRLCPDRQSQKIDELIKAFAATGQFSGVVLASENGKVIYEKPFGLANADLIPNPNKDLSEFLGNYKRNDGSTTDIVLRSGYLYSSDIKLYPIRTDCFFEYRFFGEVCFLRDEAAKIKEIKWKGFNFDLSWLKQ
jgi:hypothetical protein